MPEASQQQQPQPRDRRADAAIFAAVVFLWTFVLLAYFTDGAVPGSMPWQGYGMCAIVAAITGLFFYFRELRKP